MTAAGMDTETFLIQPGLQAPKLVCLQSSIPVTGSRLYHANPNCMPNGPIWGNGRPPVNNAQARGAREHFIWLLQQDPLYGIHIAYDMTVCLAQWPDLFGLVFSAYDDDRIIDVALSQKLIDNASGRMKFYENQEPSGYSDAGLSKRLLKRERTGKDDGWRLKYGTLYNVPLDQWDPAAVDYALQDADDPLAIGNHQWDKHQDLIANSPAQARAGFALQLMMCWGVMTDPYQIELLRDASEDLYWKLSRELAKTDLLRGEDTKPASKAWTRDTKAAKKRMFEVMKAQGRPTKLTPKGYELFIDRRKAAGMSGQPGPAGLLTDEELREYTSVDEDACKTSGDDILEKYTLRTQLHGIVKTHVPDLLKGVHTPIQPRYNTFVETGRTSCSKGKPKKKKDRLKPPMRNGYQFQNPKKSLDYFPKGVGIRNCFIARPGMYFADDDFTGLELNTGAQACLEIVGYSQLAVAINSGIDPHLLFGAKLMGISYEEARERRHEDIVKYYRQLAKVPNFGAPGGLGAPGLVGYARGYGVKLTIEEAKELLRAWFEMWPEWVDYFKYIRGLVDRVTGKGAIDQLYVGRRRGGCTYTSLSNTTFQGLGADGAKAAMFEVARRCYVKEAGSVLYGARPNGFIHDEILAEVFIELAHEQAIEMAEVMEDACNVFLPDVPVKCLPTLCKRWTKGAEPVYDRSGRLQPYDLARDGRWEVYWDDNADERVTWKVAA